MPGAPGLTAQTAAPPQNLTAETIRVEVTTTETPLATETATQRGIRDSLNEVETRLIGIERQITTIEGSLRMVRLDINILDTRLRRLETSVENLETRLATVEDRIDVVNSSIIRLQALIAELIELHTSGDAAPR